MKNVYLILLLLGIPSFLLSQFTVQELQSYLETTARKDSVIIVNTLENKYFRGEFINLRGDTLVFRNTVTNAPMEFRLSDIESVRNESGEYFFDNQMYQEARHSQQQHLRTAIQDTISARQNRAAETPKLQAQPRETWTPLPNLWASHNPDGQIGVPYLVLGSGGHIRSTLFLPENGATLNNASKTIVNPSFSAGLLLPASLHTTLKLMYQYNYNTLDNVFSGYTMKTSDHFIYFQMKVRLGK